MSTTRPGWASRLFQSIAGSSFCLGGSNCLMTGVAKRNSLKTIAASGIANITASRIIIRDNVVTLEDVAQIDLQPGTQWAGNQGYRGGSGIAANYCDPCDTLVENNDLYDNWGEQIGATYWGSHVLFVVTGSQVVGSISMPALAISISLSRTSWAVAGRPIRWATTPLHGGRSRRKPRVMRTPTRVVMSM